MTMASRIEAMSIALKRDSHYFGTTKKVNGNAVWTGKLALAPDHIIAAPLGWKKPRRVFVNSMSDLFHEDIPDEWIDRCFAVMALCPQHKFQILTKRPEQMQAYCSDPQTVDRVFDLVCDLALELYADVVLIAPGVDPDLAPPGPQVFLGRWPLPNVWLGTSCEDQATADERIPLLLDTLAAVRFISAEPLLGPIDLAAMPFNDGDPRHRFDALTGQALLYGTGVDGNPDMTVRMEKPIRQHLDWVIVGGESGRGARDFNIEWARSILNQCKAAGVACFVKQLGSNPTLGGVELGILGAGLRDKKGGDWLEWPEDIRVREFPA